MSESVVVSYLHGDDVSSNFTESLIGLLEWDRVNGKHVIGRQRARCSVEGLVKGRNQMVRRFLEGGQGDWMLWIDTDMGFAPDSLQRLLEVAHPTDRPIVGGLCFAQKLPFHDGLNGYKPVPLPTIYEWTSNEGFKVDWGYPVGEVVRCSATGSAFILIHRSVFEHVAQTYEPRNQKWYDRLVDPHREGEDIGEDLSFCLRAVSCGIPVHVHAGVKTNHHKPSWVGEQNYWNNLAPQPALDEVAVLVPVDRPDKAEAFMRSLRASSGLATAYALVDGEDETAAAWQAAGAQVKDKGEASWAKRVNHGFRHTEQPWVFLTTDEVRFHGSWFDHAVAASNNGRNQVIGVNDFATEAVMAGEHATSVLVNRIYAVTEGASWGGGLAHEGYGYWYVDEIVAVAKQRGVWGMALGSLVERLEDADGWGRPPTAKDQQLFEQRIKKHLRLPKTVPA